ncbi:putative FAD-binding domain-containing protein [Rosellinia necatrix]|uniref:Putative FAD-binding domain-containing protein n=1 Tax=Rosellinia necatrix TaxID=77044 RepID=A0A1W2TRX0_ROSNE|nr:putative FAD-binding domain-containing protein [Rosellinia necatrix]
MVSRTLSLAYAAALALPAAQAAAPYCLAGQPCFPSAASLSVFNGTIGGALIKVAPYGAACYKATYNADECKRIAEIKGDNDYRQSLPAGVMYTNLEQISQIGCPIPDPNEDGSVPAPVDRACTLGNMPSYVVNATSTAQIQKAVKFAALYNLRLRIKNSGHDYTGRSSGAGSLSIWTRHLTSTEAVSAFVPQGCRNLAGHDVVVAGSGVNVEELYNWGGANGQVTIGGYTTTVGAAGGYILGGGLGPLVPLFGLGVDNLVQIEIVTATGDVKIANQCQNSDLFWAVRGGGGAFGVTTRIWLKSYPALAAVNTVAGEVTCKDLDSYAKLINNVVDNSVALRDLGHLGIWQSSGAQAGMLLINIIPYQSQQGVKTSNQTVAEVQAVVGVDGCTATLHGSQFTGASSWNDAYQGVVWPVAKPGSLVGVNLQDHSRLVSYDSMHDDNKRQLIKDAILSLPAEIPFIWQNNCGNEATKVAADSTSVHPDWRKAFAFIDVPIFGPWAGTTAAQNATSAEVDRNSTSAYGSTQYYNEQYSSANWQADFFGSNYARLLQVKNSVDPKRVFNCPLCVGSEGGY